ncbi:MAG TPA: serine hydrolase, partial [Ktedonobacteraceae bacterium]
MRKTPSEDDEQTEQPTDNREHPRPAKQQRRKSVKLPEQVAHIYADEEHPEIPKIRRASLHTRDTEEELPPRTQAARTRRPRKTEEHSGQKRTRPADDDTAPRSKRPASTGISSKSERAVGSSTVGRSTRPATSASARRRAAQPSTRPTTSASARRRAAQQGAATRASVKEQAPPSRASGRITTEHRRRSSVDELPRPSVRHIRESYTPQLISLSALFAKARSNLERVRNNRTLMLTCMVIIVIAVLIPIASHIQQGQPEQVIGGFSSTANGTNAPSKDSHTITITPSDTDHPAPPVYAASAYLLDAHTGATLYASNAFVHRPMLSTTKLMTVLLAVEKGNLNQNVTITSAMQQDLNGLAPDSSLMGVKPGETYTLRDLLYGALLASGNDAATVIADDIGGNQQNFVAMMNQRAHELGLNDTHYMNPHGLLQDGHYSCAHDLAILGSVDFANPTLRQIMGTNEYHITKNAQHADHDMFNGDQFQWWYPGTDGGKPGYDGVKNFNQVVSVTHNNRELIGVTMDTNNWWTDMRDLMNWGFDNFTWISPYDVDFQHPIPFDVDWNYFTDDKKVNTIPTSDHGRYYIFTGYSISGLIMTYYDKNGGLSKIGYPRGMPQTTTTTQTQHFDFGNIQC